VKGVLTTAAWFCTVPAATSSRLWERRGRRYGCRKHVTELRYDVNEVPT